MRVYTFIFDMSDQPFNAPHYKAQIFEVPEGFKGGFGDTGSTYEGRSSEEVAALMQKDAPRLPLDVSSWSVKDLPEGESV